MDGARPVTGSPSRELDEVADRAGLARKLKITGDKIAHLATRVAG